MGKGQRIKAERRSKREAQIRKRATEAAQILMECPVAGKFFPTGIYADPVSFNGGTFNNVNAPCPHCGAKHSGSDAELVLAN
ncbi:hypothetical protein [Arthrobacter sp. NA-172]|uniref:hypothetical protein n=1 Tax=Arthrobacter sp. NA-172 TaxID=3367524 RepID=UPI00375535E8